MRSDLTDLVDLMATADVPWAQVDELLEGREYIKAIKLVRLTSGASLNNSKLAVDLRRADGAVLPWRGIDEIRTRVNAHAQRQRFVNLSHAAHHLRQAATWCSRHAALRGLLESMIRQVVELEEHEAPERSSESQSGDGSVA